jgi:hypothetical protein
MFDRLNTVQMRDRFDAQFEARGTDTWYRQDGLGPAFEISADTRDDLQRRYHSRFRLAAMGFGTVILAPVIVRVLRGNTPLMHQSHLGPEGTGWALWIGLGLVGLMLTRTVLWRDPSRRVKGLTPVAPPLTEDARDHVVLPSMSWVHIHAVLFSALFILSSVRWTDPLTTAVNRVCLLTGLASLLCGLFVASQRLRRERRA